MSRYLNDHWQQVMKIILDSGVHPWFSAEQGWCFLSANGQRIKVTDRVSIADITKIVNRMKEGAHVYYDESTSKNFA